MIESGSTSLLQIIFPWLIFGYLIGSIVPGYFFGRLVKGIDLRKFGNHGTGTVNTYNFVGPAYGLFTAAFDFFKAILVYFLSINGLDLLFVKLGALHPDQAILAGLAVVVGHIFPFYLKFKGGMGMAALLGLMTVAVGHSHARVSDQSLATFFLTVLGTSYIVAIAQPLRKFHWSWRNFLKLGGLIFPIWFLLISEGQILKILAILMVSALFFDLVRFVSKKFNDWYLAKRGFAKSKERGRFSGYTLFFLGSFLALTLFPARAAVPALIFFIIGDLAGPIGGMLFFKRKLVREKTWGGAFLIFTVCFIAGFFLKFLAPLNLGWGTVALGALAASFLDQFSFLVDDNLLVPLGVAAILSLL